MVFLSVDRIKHPARGRDGGASGAPGRIRLNGDPDLPGKGEVRIGPNDLLIFETPGGGGFGTPFKRSRERVAEDLAEGLVSAEAADVVYGFGRYSEESELS
jgi:N-methylhydantoinase B